MVNPNITHHMLVSMALLICSHASQVLTVDKALAVGFTTLVLFDLCYFLDQENAEPNGGRASLGFSYAQLTMNKCKEFHKPVYYRNGSLICLHTYHNKITPPSE